MDLQSTSKWICDKCGKEIDNIKDGWLQWLSYEKDGKYKYRGLQIVHRTKCLYDENFVFKQHNATVADGDLESFSGSDGLTTLLSFISEGSFVDSEEILEIIKRIFTPGYEQARFYFAEAIENGVFEPDSKPNYHSQTDIKSVLDYISQKNN